jgi:hypothetical protein
LVDGWVVPLAGRRVFLIDKHDNPAPAVEFSDPYVLEYRQDRHVRRLEDGPAYNVVKVRYQPAELEALLTQLGWSADVRATRWFLFGSARPS